MPEIEVINVNEKMKAGNGDELVMTHVMYGFKEIVGIIADTNQSPINVFPLYINKENPELQDIPVDEAQEILSYIEEHPLSFQHIKEMVTSE